MEATQRTDNSRQQPAEPVYLGAAKVTIVNPDQGAAQRIENTLGQHAKCKWLPKPVAQWVSEDC
jgi:hypothetical protein